MIVAVRCNQPSFKSVEFSPGFNVVLADRTKESTKLDSRNGLGKTTLIEVIHFCLGARTRSRGQGLRVKRLEEWSFTLDLRIAGRELSVTRSIDDPTQVILEGEVDGLSLLGERQLGSLTLDINDWNMILGDLFFGLGAQEEGLSYGPTFRSLFSYFARRGRGGFISPFSHHTRQHEWDRQVNNAFLLGLAWEHASQFQGLRDEERTLSALRRAGRQGLLQGMVGTRGNLEAERTRLESRYRRQAQQLESFRVHPQYTEIEQEANELTATIQELTNANLVDGALADLYRDSLEDEQDPGAEETLEVYRAVGIAMPALVRRRLSEVQDFHRQLLTNRRAYIQAEIQRIEANKSQRKLHIQDASERRAQLLGVLQAYGALNEYNRLQELHLAVVSELNDIDRRIDNLRRFEQGKSEARVKREILVQTARREFEERRYAREAAINLFNLNSEALYSAPGNLVLDVVDTGFKFDVEIMRSGSQGIENMKILCYDLMLAQLWSTRRHSSALLIHDSTVFDGVDERQVAHALELAATEAESRGFQYVCALNSDTLPLNDFSSEFGLGGFVRLRLTDESAGGGLLGIRY